MNSTLTNDVVRVGGYARDVENDEDELIRPAFCQLSSNFRQTIIQIIPNSLQVSIQNVYLIC
jgi:hypothetical protein